AADGIHVLRARVVLGGGLLRDQQDRFPCFHRGFHRLDGLRASHEERDHHVWEHHDIAQRQQRVLDDFGGGGGAGGLLGHFRVASSRGCSSHLRCGFPQKNQCSERTRKRRYAATRKRRR